MNRSSRSCVTMRRRPWRILYASQITAYVARVSYPDHYRKESTSVFSSSLAFLAHVKGERLAFLKLSLQWKEQDRMARLFDAPYCRILVYEHTWLADAEI